MVDSAEGSVVLFRFRQDEQEAVNVLEHLTLCAMVICFIIILFLPQILATDVESCPPGTQFAYDHTFRCEPCPDTNYQDQTTYNKEKCKVKTICPFNEGKYTIYEGNSTSNRKCACREGYLKTNILTSEEFECKFSIPTDKSEVQFSNSEEDGTQEDSTNATEISKTSWKEILIIVISILSLAIILGIVCYIYKGRKKVKKRSFPASSNKSLSANTVQDAQASTPASGPPSANGDITTGVLSMAYSESPSEQYSNKAIPYQSGAVINSILDQELTTCQPIQREQSSLGINMFSSQSQSELSLHEEKTTLLNNTEAEESPLNSISISSPPAYSFTENTEVKRHQNSSERSSASSALSLDLRSDQNNSSTSCINLPSSNHDININMELNGPVQVNIIQGNHNTINDKCHNSSKSRV